MEIIMILNAPLILVIDLCSEILEYLEVNCLIKIISHQQRTCYEWHLHLPADRVDKFEQIERK